MMTLFLFLQWAIVNLSCNFMRSEPSYSSENVSQSRMGVVVEVLEEQDYWVKIRTPEPYEGWVNRMGLQYVDETLRDEWLSAPRYICLTEYTHIYESPSLAAPRISNFTMGDILRQGGQKRMNWVSVILPSGEKGWVRKYEVADFFSWAGSSFPEPEKLVQVAKRFIGTPYMWGGISAGTFDCSGLVGFCWFMNGALLPRDASQQAKLGEEVSFEDMQCGDLVFFGQNRVSHVGLCIGNRRIIHSSQLVRVNSLDKGSPDFYPRNIITIRRIKDHKRIISSPAYFKQ